MNIEQAKTISISVILDKLNYKPQKQKHNQVVYFSPFRDEKTPSLNIQLEKNIWFDFGLGKGGSVIEFVCTYLESQNENNTVSDALRWLKNMVGHYPRIKPVFVKDYSKEDSTLIVRECIDVQNKALIKYAADRGISDGVTKTYLQEAKVYNTNTKKTFSALCLRNEDKGYELRNPFFKGCVGKKAITFMRGQTPKPDGINVFEGLMDFLSIVEQNGKPLDDDAIILNSISCMEQATGFIRNYGYTSAYTWMDNDKAGQAATQAWDEFFKTEEGLLHYPMNETYENHKDVNAWHMYKLAL
jgi:hypothetical protein